MTKSTLFHGRLLLLTAACSLPELGAEPLAAAMPEPPLAAYLHGGKLFCLHVQERDGESNQPLKPMELWHAKLTLKDAFKKEKERIHVTTAYERLPDRWRVSHGYFWWQEDHTSHDAGSVDVVELTRIPLEKVSIPVADPRRDALQWEWDLPLAPVYYVRITADAATKKDVYFDLIPDSKDELNLLVAWRGEIRIWRGGIRWRDRDKDPQFKDQKDMPKRLPGIKWDNAKRPDLRVRTDLREGFLAYQDKTHYFFITVSGKLYSCRKRGEDQRTELLWNDPRSPIRAVIHDSASNKTFVFTKALPRADKEGRDVWFELAPKVESVAYDAKKIPELKPADPLASMMEYARILMKKKKIKSEDEKPKSR
jgi:hypothetical protein